MTPVKRPATWLILGVFLISCIGLHFDFTPAGVNDHPADSLFSVRSASAHLSAIARAPHSLGTPAHDSVGAYIDTTCRSLGLTVERLPFTTGIKPNSSRIVVGRGVNIVATLKGTGGGKKILVMGHYDSEPNAIGAGDDGSACAAMLETARALQRGTALDRDVVFLFTDGEEDGLLGALAFTRDSARLADIGVVLNFDGRGNAGNCLMFRTSPYSHWLIDGYARAPIHHAAASFYNELFNRLPNNTDLTPFLRAHKQGLDFAYVEGFTAYHNLTDNFNNIDRGTMQEEGDNMLGMVRYFGHMDVETAAAADAGKAQANDTFFNLPGALLVHYSPTLNFMLVLAANLLVLLSLGYGLILGRIRITHLLLGLLLFIVTLAVLYFVARWTLLGFRAMYPPYLGYYPNRYHTGYLYITLAAESALLFTLLYRWPLRRWSLSSLFMSVLILLLILLDVLYRYIPSGVYWLYWPLIGAAAAFPFRRVEKKRNTRPPRFWLILIALLPAVLFLPPMVYSLAIAFDIQEQAAINGIVMGLLLGLTLPLLKPAFRETGWLLSAFALCMIMIAGIAGIATGGYSTRRPFKTDLHYVVQTDSNKASWVSSEAKPCWFTKPYLSHPALFLDLPGPELHLDKGFEDIAANKDYADTTGNKGSEGTTGNKASEDTASTHEGARYEIHCKPPPGARSIHLVFDPDHPPTALRIDGTDYNGPVGWLDYTNPDSAGFDLLITIPRGTQLHIVATSRSMGLPAAAGFKGYPSDVIPFPGFYANMTMVERTYNF
jgi:hypothetical protein